MESIVGTKTSVQAHWRKNARKLLTIFSYELSSCERNGVFSSMFRKIIVSKQSISSAFMFLRMLRSCFITNIRYFFCFLRKISELCGKYRNYAEDADFSELCGSASPHPVRCHVTWIPYFGQLITIRKCQPS